jgi:microcystin-dependent protein
LKASDLNDAFAAVGVAAGTIVAWGGKDAASVPAGWLLCDGSAVDRIQYAALFKAIAINFGVGDQIKTFNLPNLQGYFLRGLDPTGKVDTEGMGMRAVGSVQQSEFASHDHGGGNHSHTFSTSPCTHTNYHYSGIALDGDGTYDGNCGDDSSHTRPSGAVISAQGGAETRPLNVAVNYIIKY